MDDRETEFARADREAREYTTRTPGYERKDNPVLEAIKVFMFVTILPWLGLPLLGVSQAMVETPLIILGVFAGLAVYWYLSRKNQRWSRVYAQRFCGKEQNTPL